MKFWNLRNITRLSCLILFLLSPVTALLAQERETESREEETEDKWRLVSVPYLWAAGLKGDITVKGATTDVDVGFDTIKDHLEVGFMTYMELRRDKFGFFFNPMYMKLTADGSISDGGDADIEQKLWIVELGGFYNLHEWCDNHPIRLDALGGGRYWNNNIELDFSGPLLGSRSTSNTEDLTDLFAGLRVHQQITER